MMKMLPIFALIGLASCARPPVEEAEDARKADSPEPNVIFFSESWPIGTTYALSDEQAKKLKSIVWGTEIEDPFSKLPHGMTVSPASDFSYFCIYGRTYHFVPPGKPHNFKLSKEKLRMLQGFMKDEFGIAERWQQPKPSRSQQELEE